MIAALATVIQSAGYEFADDDTYRQHATSMQAKALALREAAQAGDYDRARTAVGEVSKACAGCHEGFRN
jgi:cytochrome c556